EDAAATVAEDTVRISAMAFAGNGSLTQVILPHTVSSIGHKAFYACEKLRLVSFSSYDAPVLEEEYDYAYFMSGEHIPATGKYTFYTPDGLSTVEIEGLGILPYFMWNAADVPTSIYYGASFIDYIGHVEQKITMVRPVNGRCYDSFVLAQYFDTAVDGAAAADATTLKAIAAIKLIPDVVTLADKSLVEAARAAYNLISLLEQRALVTEYAKLTQAEKRIEDLEFLEKGEQPENPVDPPAEPQTPIDPDFIVILLLSCVTALMTVVAVVFAILLTKQVRLLQKDADAPTEAPSEKETPAEEASEEAAEEASEEAAEEASEEEAPAEEAVPEETGDGETEPKSDTPDEA
ncbi:MAG: leucine-rich repeat protein, partial [Clostridia bacterium]|nr:leucine-rich repeat protein [Clostridia bacterium]